jgi:hypothetical protein
VSIEAVKALADSWIAEAKSLDENAGVTQQWSGVPLTEEVIANRKAVARQLTEQANAVLAALGEAMPEPSASPDHEFVFGSVQSMRIRVWNETSRATCIVDFDGIMNPAGHIAAFVAGLSPLGDHPEARRVENGIGG